MEVKELRIGNWVLDKKTNKFVEVDGIQFSGRIVVLDENYDDGKRGIDPEPISLTSEILEKCGFKKRTEKREDVMAFTEDMRELKQWNTYISWEHKSGYSVDSLANYKIEFLHTLQNCFYFKTGKELEINLYVETNV